MGFNVKDWKDYPDTSTPITAAALEDVETRLGTFVEGRTAVSVVEFGAVGNGTTDDRTAILAACNALTSGGTVFFPIGSYKIGSDMTIPDGVTWRGVGYGSLIKTDSIITGVNHVTVEDLRFEGTTTACVKFTGTNCHARSLTGSKLVIEFNGASDWSCVDCDFVAGTASMGGIQTYNGATRGRIIGNKVTGCNTNGVGLNSSTHISVIGNDCHDNTNSGIAPLNGCSYILIVGNRCNGNAADGVDCNSGAMNVATYFTVANNQCRDNGSTGIYLVGSSNAAIGNMLVANGTWGLRVGRYDVDATTGTNVTIAGNSAFGNTTGAFDIADGHVTDPHVYGNTPQPVDQNNTYTALTYSNSWVNYGGSYGTAGYRKDALGDVVLSGVIKDGTATAGTTMFTLPAGYRPSTIKAFVTQSGAAFACVSVETDGAVKIQAGSNGGLCLDPIRFRATA